jgi:hypothetical protein
MLKIRVGKVAYGWSLPNPFQLNTDSSRQLTNQLPATLIGVPGQERRSRDISALVVLAFSAVTVAYRQVSFARSRARTGLHEQPTCDS